MDLNEKTLLVIDDQKDVCEIIKGHFESQGMRVVCAVEGAAGFQLVEYQPPDCVLLDIRIPEGEDGLTFLRKIRSFRNDNPDLEDKIRKLPVIMLTGAGTGMRELLTSRGFKVMLKNLWTLKPFKQRLKKSYPPKNKIFFSTT